MRWATFGFYVLSFLLCIGGAGYVVFFLGRSPWWMLAGLVIFCCVQVELTVTRRPSPTPSEKP